MVDKPSGIKAGDVASVAPSQLVLALPHRQALGAEDFFVSDSNAAAVDLVDVWPDWPHSAAIVVGPPGSGKSHLANVWRLRSGANMLTSGQVDEAAVPSLAERRGVVVEDIDRGLADERALFHILNLARESQFSVLVTAQRPPGELSVALPDLRSRLRALPVVEIAMPDQSLLKAVMVKLFSDRQLAVEPHVINYLVTRMERSLAAARDVVRIIDDLALAKQRPVTRSLAGDALQAVEASKSQA